MRREPRELELYRHFKGTLYQVITIAINTETSEKMVVYRALEKPERVFARPLGMFLGEVDHGKYPDIKARYRFTEVNGLEENETGETGMGETKTKGSGITEDEPAEAGITEDEPAESEEAGSLDPVVEAILDEKQYTKKIEGFLAIRNRYTREMLDIIAMTHDIELTGDTDEDDYRLILDHFKMHEKYESDRLRTN